MTPPERLSCRFSRPLHGLPLHVSSLIPPMNRWATLIRPPRPDWDSFWLDAVRLRRLMCGRSLTFRSSLDLLRGYAPSLFRGAAPLTKRGVPVGQSHHRTSGGRAAVHSLALQNRTHAQLSVRQIVDDRPQTPRHHWPQYAPIAKRLPCTAKSNTFSLLTYI